MATSPRLPSKADFPTNLTVDIIPPTAPQKPVNILVLLHGLGDTQVPFTRLASQLQLPETCCISVRAPSPIPALFTGSDEPAFHWGDDVLFDEGKGEIDLDAGFKTASVVLGSRIVSEVLIEKCGYSTRNIIFYGYGQGGMAALSVVASSEQEFGGVVSVGGGLPSSFSSSGAAGKSKTPVLVLGGSRSKEVTKSKVEGLKGAFESMEYVKWAKHEDSMPKSREEMLPIMKFFARRLKSRAGVPEGAVEV